jgi:hypothetical protein
MSQVLLICSFLLLGSDAQTRGVRQARDVRPKEERGLFLMTGRGDDNEMGELEATIDFEKRRTLNTCAGASGPVIAQREVANYKSWGSFR